MYRVIAPNLVVLDSLILALVAVGVERISINVLLYGISLSIGRDNGLLHPALVASLLLVSLLFLLLFRPIIQMIILLRVLIITQRLWCAWLRLCRLFYYNLSSLHYLSDQVQ
jgi:hypothetical protein